MRQQQNSKAARKSVQKKRIPRFLCVSSEAFSYFAANAARAPSQQYASQVGAEEGILVGSPVGRLEGDKLGRYVGVFEGENVGRNEGRAEGVKVG